KRYAAEAGKGYLLHEPQVNAWYAVEGDTVTVLDGSVTGVANGTKTTIEAYRAMLHSRYADKLPGSAYDRDGAGGGYGGRERAVPPAAPDTVPVLPFAVGGVLVLLAGAAVVPRLRRR
ncbi:MAG: hypothetical protein QOI78_6469, partial [Actinomycetota bacterium]|nr:hypothetical protein [Actinomycetota bacterium]